MKWPYLWHAWIQDTLNKMIISDHTLMWKQNFKHFAIFSSHAITSDVSLIETAKAAEYFLADAVILTGTATGVPAKPEELRELKETTGLPILIGSGVTLNNLENYTEASALIVGSYFKKNGLWSNEIDEEKVRIFMEKAKVLFQWILEPSHFIANNIIDSITLGNTSKIPE